MLAPIDFPAFRPLVLFSVLLILKMGAVAFATSNARRKAKVVLNRMPENAPYQQATNFSRKQWVDLLDWLITL